MSDSESDTNSNVFTFPNVTTVSAKGPNTNITNLSFRNQLTSTMCMPRNFAFDQKSMYYRRETSPMSIHSACDIRPRNFQQYYSGMSSRQSVFNGRSGSPMSIRSIDSSASVSAAEIAFAFKNVKYNKHDLKVIKDAYHKLMKQRVRKRIEKRRNMRLFLKGSRRISGYDSGEQGSNSSISSDDSRSIKTSCKENMSSVRSARIALPDFRKTDNFRQHSVKNNFSVESHSVNPHNFNNTVMSKQSNPMPTQKDRFRNGFLLPSQRFNRSVASLSIPETAENPYKNRGNTVMNNMINHCNQNKHKSCASGSEEEIFSEVRERSTSNNETQRKRSFDSDEESFPDKKKCKRSSPIKNPQTNKPKSINAPVNNIDISNTFEFVKPSLPVRKLKPRVQEQLIAKSSQPLTDLLEPVANKIQNNLQSVQSPNLQSKSCELDQSETTQNSDVSMRPSFIKRKLFTQKLDVAEKANLSTDGTSSPQNSVYLLQKEKNKARKLVTNQSCLNREVQDDNNLLDLIHKIVPPDRMNISNQTTINQTRSDLNNKNKQSNEDKWDVTSVISMCNGDDVSDTYTDEEIFEGETTKKETKRNKASKMAVNNTQINQDCKVMVERLHEDNTTQKLPVTKNFNFTHNNITSTNVKCSAKSFWDTDSENDAEWSTTVPQSHFIDNVKKANAMLEARKENFKNTSGHASNLCNVSKYSQQTPAISKQINNISMNSMNNTVTNNTLDSMRKFDPSTLSIRSHRTSKKKKCCNETCATVIKTNVINQNNILIENKNHNSIEHTKKSVEKKNLKPQNKTSTETCKPKKNTKNENLPNPVRSSSHGKKTPTDKKSKIDKPDSAKKSNTKKSESKSKLAKLNTTVSNGPKHKSQNNNSSEKNKTANQCENKQVKTIPISNAKNDDRKNRKDTLSKSPKNKYKSNVNRESSTRIRSTQNNSVLQPTVPALNNAVGPLQVTKSGRPIRSCRTPSQSRSIELSRSSKFNNTSDSTRSLRSRTIDLSSSIENITIKIKPRNKTKNNKNITIIQTRKSDVSFSLGSDKRTPTPNKYLACKRADFFKGKRRS